MNLALAWVHVPIIVWFHILIRVPLIEKGKFYVHNGKICTVLKVFSVCLDLNVFEIHSGYCGGLVFLMSTWAFRWDKYDILTKFYLL